MIVQCESCQTRFKVPDDKVTEKGVKVRCSKCQHTFRVSRDANGGPVITSAGAPPPAPPPAPAGTRENSGLYDPDRTKVAPYANAQAAGSSGLPPESLGEPPPSEPAPAEPPASPPPSSLLDELDWGPEPTSVPGSGAAPPPAPPPPNMDRALFEMPSAPPPPAEEGFPQDGVPPPPSLGTPVAVPATNGVASAERRPVPKAGGDELGKEGISWARRAGGLAMNLVVGAVLVVLLAALGNVYLNEGRLDWNAISFASLMSLLHASQGVVARDVSNGLYETRSGASILYVRGELDNRSERSSRLKVHAELWDGNLVVRSVDGYAGTVATPEDLYQVTGPQDVEALANRLKAGAVVASPGSRLPFLVVFGAYPADLTGLKLKVTASAAP